MIAKDVRKFLKRFETTLTELARDGRHVQLKARFEDYHKLLDAWLDVAPPGTSLPPQLRFLALVDRFGGPFEIETHEIARAAAESDDSSTVVEVAEQLIHGALACHHRDQPRLMEGLLNPLVFLYYKCIERDSLADALGYRLDSGLHSLFMAVRLYPTQTAALRVTSPSESPALDVVLRFSLSLIHAAIRYEKCRHAEFFVDRIFEHRRHSRRNSIPDEPVSMGPEVLFDYVAIVLTGWLLHLLQSNVLKTPGAAHQVLQAALAQVPSIPVLLAEWELLRGAGRYESEIDKRLGVSQWDFRDWQREFRSGVGEFRSEGTDWIRLGLRASLLLSREPFFADAQLLFADRPRRFVWDAAMERGALISLAADQWIGIPETERQQRVDSVMKIIEQRARGANADYLRYVLDSPLSDSRVAELREEAAQAFYSNQLWQGALRHTGLSIEQVRLCPLRTQWCNWVPREYLLDDNNRGSGIGKYLGEIVATREAIDLIHSIEESAPRAGQLGALAVLPERIREARRLMIEEGFQPNVIILPLEDRFAGALFRKPLWQVVEHKEFGIASIGIWEQLHVLRFPYKNPKTILLIDTQRLVAETGADDGTPTVSVWVDENSPNDQVASNIAASREALNSADLTIPESNSIKVLVRMEVVPHLGLVDINAARAIIIGASDAGFAIVDGSDLYHRPACPDIEGDYASYVLRVEPDSGKSPCPTCKPQMWNVEGRQGKLHGT